MKESARARVAAIVRAAASGKAVSSVYDYLSSRHRTTSVTVSNGGVSGYDHDTSSHFSGSGGGGNLNFYDYETSNHVALKMNGSHFSGYDYHSGKHFSGSINGNAVSLYDYETGQHYNYNT